MKFNIFKKEKKPDEDSAEYYELEHEKSPAGQIKIVVEKAGAASDSNKIVKHVKDGNIAFVRIKDLKETNLNELKILVSKVKSACISSGGDVAGVGDEWLIVAPSTAQIVRKGDSAVE